MISFWLFFARFPYKVFINLCSGLYSDLVLFNFFVKFPRYFSYPFPLYYFQFLPKTCLLLTFKQLFNLLPGFFVIYCALACFTVEHALSNVIFSLERFGTLIIEPMIAGISRLFPQSSFHHLDYGPSHTRLQIVHALFLLSIYCG